MKDDHRRYLQKGEQAGGRFVLAAPRRAPLGVGGAHLSNRAGASLEFRDHREYQPGDDLRRIDWSAYARTDRLIVKLYQEEVSPHLDIVIDGSRSMALEETAKLEATLGLAAVFSVAAANAGFSRSAWLAREGCQKVEGSAGAPSSWETAAFDFSGDLFESFSRTRPRWRCQGMRVLLSDLLWPGDPLLALQYLARDAAAVVVVQVLAAADREPALRGNTRLVDSETGEAREIFIDATSVARYHEALDRHQQNWSRACRQAGAVMTTLPAEATVEEWKLEELVAAEILRG
ncbi:MAG TPA: DUF58 domain-containing protein [Blastocatellia bacterium]|nr:DUF58 domain-containing protein [Blastocatellia bacterium]